MQAQQSMHKVPIVKSYAKKILWGLTMMMANSGCGSEHKASTQNISTEIVCSLVTRAEAEGVIGKPLQEGRTNPKLNFPGTYYCEWRAVGGIVPLFTLYYYTRRFSTLVPYAIYDNTQPIAGLSHGAIAVLVPSDQTIAQFISYTDKGAISFALFQGVSNKSTAYKKIAQLLDKVSQTAP